MIKKNDNMESIEAKNTINNNNVNCLMNTNIITQNEMQQHSTIDKKHKILIAEDDDINYLFLETILNDFCDLNLSLIHAKNGKEALDIFHSQEDLSLVLMDIKMPVMNGCVASKEIKHDKPDLPIIAQSAYADGAEKAMIIESCCDDFIQKPIDKDNLIILLRKHLKLN